MRTYTTKFVSPFTARDLSVRVGCALIALPVVIFLSFSSASAQVKDSLSIDRVIREVLKNNDRLAAAKYMAESAERRAQSAGTWDDPMLMFGVQNLPSNFDFKMDPMTMKMVGISQNIPYAGQKGLERKAARSEAQASAEQTRETEADLVIAARQAYFDLYYRRQNLLVLEAQREIVNQIIAATTARLRSNQAGQDEVLSSQAELGRLESSILSQQQQIEAVEQGLNAIRGVDPATKVPELIAPPFDLVPDSVAVWINLAEQNYPAVKRVNRQAEGYRFSAEASRRMRWPMLGLAASYGIRSGEEMLPDGMFKPRDNMVSFQANLSLPIFSRRAQTNMARSMEAMQKSRVAEANQLWRDAQADLQSLYARAVRLQKSLELYRERVVPASEDAYRSGLAGYTSNRLPFTSLLDYAITVNRDKITANDIAGELGRTLAEVYRYTATPIDSASAIRK
jgi:cobalt-zinc-cadmium efflux system outer membrane protein